MMDNDLTSSNNVSEISGMLARAGLSGPALWKRKGPLLGLAGVVVAVGIYLSVRDGAGATQYVTQEVTRGELTVTVTATGNLEPRNQVDIGSELSGTIRSVHADVNDTVKAGQLLAVLDTTRLKAQALQARGSLAAAQARVLQTEASLKETRANHERLLKVRELSGNKLPSQQDMDVAEAAVARAEAEAASAQAAVAQQKATLDVILTDLGKSEIRSPTDGVVLVRSVEPGQTVAASFQAPVLFTLAEDLKKMELHVAVDEADVGSIQVRQKATFTVDAFPNRTFSAHITQVHFASNNTQKSAAGGSANNSPTATGVVTYETVLEVDNSELLLRPGMTATADIVTTSLSDIVLVPNAALRFTPEDVQMPGPRGQGERGGSPFMAIMPQFRRRSDATQQQGGSRRMGRVWVVEEGQPALVLFKPGASDGRMTQVLKQGAPADKALQGPMANDEFFKKALERRLEPGTKVIVDAQGPQS
jgi:HlyD family secretion protein